MKCFIACAFGKEDVDTMYKVIKSVLKSLNITAIRVDQIDHNKRIDQKIIELIDSCDFGIADLTYARPSVYYEAGRIHGLGRNVIFTCRNDHFKPKQDDEFGNFRVHFDLITENIVGWHEDLSGFEEKLERRIRKVIKPILKQAQENKKIDQEQQTFQRMSLSERREIARVQTIKTVKRKRFTIFSNEKGVIVSVKNKVSATVILLNIVESMPLNEIWMYENKKYGILKKVTEAGYKVQEVIVLLVSIGGISEATIHKALPMFSRSESTLKEFYDISNDGKQTRFIVIDKVKSPVDLTNRLEKIFS
jgi:hypothetical protein